MASRKHVVDLDMQQNQLLNVTAQVLAADPAAVAGQFWYRSNLANGTGNGVLRYQDSSGNVFTIATGSTAISNAYSTVTDGTTPQAASGASTLTVAATGTGLTVNTTTSKTLTYALNSSATSSANAVVLAGGGGKISSTYMTGVLGVSDLTTTTTGSGNNVLGTGPTISNPIISGSASTTAGALGISSSQLTVGDGTNSHIIVTLDQSQTLTNKTLTQPTIGDHTNATHNHTNAAGGGTLTHAAISDFNTQVQTNTLNSLASPTASVSMNSQTITSLANPVNPQDAATKNYVDSNIQGLDPKPTANAATTGALPANTYANGTSGVGATLTATANAALVAQDGVTLTAGQLLLVKNEATAANNGLYVVTTVGSVSVPYVLTRHVDMDSTAEIAGAFIPVGSGGTTNANSLWLANPSGIVTVGTTSIPFTQLNGATDLTQGNGISISGNTISASLAARLVFNGSAIDLASGIVTAGTYGQVTVDTYGRVTSAVAINTGTFGGTGVNNGGNTITLGGNLVTSGAFSTTLTVTANTNVTLPTSGTLCTTVGSSSIVTVGTITTGTWNGTTIAVANGGTGQTSASAARGTSGLGAATAPTTQTNVTISAAGIPTMVKATITGTGVATSFTITHNLGNSTPLIQLMDSSGNVEECAIQATDSNTVVVSFNAAPANLATFSVVVIG